MIFTDAATVFLSTFDETEHVFYPDKFINNILKHWVFPENLDWIIHVWVDV